LFGGRSGATYFNETWAWNGSTWTQINAPGPAGRARLGFAYDGSDGYFVLFGGGSAGGFVGDTWHLSMTSPCPADIPTGGNCGDGTVGVNDLLAVITAWGPCAAPCPPRCAADISPSPSGDCTVGVNDLLAVITSWGACP
jgi:hypothetical protein